MTTKAQKKEKTKHIKRAMNRNIPRSELNYEEIQIRKDINRKLARWLQKKLNDDKKKIETSSNRKLKQMVREHFNDVKMEEHQIEWFDQYVPFKTNAPVRYSPLQRKAIARLIISPFYQKVLYSDIIIDHPLKYPMDL